MADIDSNLPTKDTADGASGSAAPSITQQVGGTDGTNLRTLSTDNTGKLNLNNISGTVSLPTGASTSTHQTDGSQKSQIVDGSGNVIGSIPSAGINNLAVALGATNYVASTANSTTAQLTVGSTFTGTIENTFNQPSYSILLTSDQPVLLTINQYIDAAGVYRASSSTITVKANQGLAISNVVNANFLNLTIQNIGTATTTTLNLNTAYGIIDASTNLNHAPVSLDEVNGTQISASPYGNLSVSTEATALFADTFDSSGLDTTNRWNSPVVAGAGATSQSLGSLTLSTGTGASSAVAISSQPTFTPLGTSFFQLGGVFQFEASIGTNTHRFVGLGTPNPSYTASTPLLNAIGFEIDISGNFNAVIYSNGSKVFSSNLNIYKNYISGTPGILGIVTRADVTFFYVGNINNPVATSALITPDSLLLPIRLHMINNTSGPGSAPTYIAQAFGMGDTAGNGISISDGTYAWRKAKVDNNGLLSVSPRQEPNAQIINANSYTYQVATALNVQNTETNNIYLKNNSLTKTVYLYNTFLTQDVANANNWMLFKLYYNPTVTVNGSAGTISNMSAGSSNTSASNVYTAPTVTVRGTLMKVWPSGINSAASPIQDTLFSNYYALPPGQSLLITATAKANSQSMWATLMWFEV